MCMFWKSFLWVLFVWSDNNWHTRDATKVARFWAGIVWKSNWWCFLNWFERFVREIVRNFCFNSMPNIVHLNYNNTLRMSWLKYSLVLSERNCWLFVFSLHVLCTHCWQKRTSWFRYMRLHDCMHTQWFSIPGHSAEYGCVSVRTKCIRGYVQTSME